MYVFALFAVVTFRLVLLLALAIIALFLGIGMVLRWHNHVNNARMALLALDDAFSFSEVASGIDGVLSA